MPSFTASPYTRHGTFWYDAVATVGLAAWSSYNSTVGILNGTFQYNAFIDSDFAGVSGRIKIDPTTGNCEPASAFYQVSNYRCVPSDQPDDIFASVSFQSSREFNSYSSLTRTPPPDHNEDREAHCRLLRLERTSLYTRTTAYP